jgi:hypothetical protein
MIRRVPSVDGRMSVVRVVPHETHEVIGCAAHGMVDTYKIRGCKKLGLRSRASIVRFALGQGWLETEK